MTGFERFTAALGQQYANLFVTHPAYRVHRTKGTNPDTLALDVTRGLLDGGADKSGAGVIATCRALGIPHTYKAIKAYLKEPTK
jgi:hypothetical protein